MSGHYTEFTFNRTNLTGLIFGLWIIRHYDSWGEVRWAALVKVGLTLMENAIQ